MTLANKVTIVRILCIPAIVYFLITGRIWISFGIFSLALASDVVDGLVARSRNEETELGKMLDPFADKILFLSLTGTFAYLKVIPVYLFLALLIPYTLLIIGSIFLHERGRSILNARTWGKFSSLVLATGLALLYLNAPFKLPVIYSGIGLAYVATLYYILSARGCPECTIKTDKD
ncbi:MAG: CDP-alcohol phosphatidyltransferase family protein [Candidatus Bipolaricaulota bacterium]